MTIGRLSVCLALILSSGCQARSGLPVWLGGATRCELGGDIVEEDLTPAVAIAPVGSLTHAVYHILPETGTRVTLRLRIDERGYVTGGCPVGEAPADLVKALVRYAGAPQDYGSDRLPTARERPPYLPARAHGRNVPSAVTVTFRWEAPTKEDWTSSGGVRESTNVRALEATAMSAASHAPQGAGGAAYARLGELGTPAARLAIARIEQAARGAQCDLAKTLFEHFMPDGWATFATTQAPDGTQYRVVQHPLFAGAALGLTWRHGKDSTWARPYLIPHGSRPYLGSKRKPRLRWLRTGRLELSFEEDLTRWACEGASVPMRPLSVPKRVVLVVSELVRDSDGDGWTDIEEQRMGLDPRSTDTDGDGVPDARDTCPNHAAWPGEGRDETGTILQKALVAAFGLPEKGGITFRLAGPDVKPVSLIGWAGPLVYGQTDACRPNAWNKGATWVGWRIVRQTATEAAVEIEQSSGGTSGRGYEVFLRKRDGAWWVVLRDLTWIS